MAKLPPGPWEVVRQGSGPYGEVLGIDDAEYKPVISVAYPDNLVIPEPVVRAVEAIPAMVGELTTVVGLLEVMARRHAEEGQERSAEILRDKIEKIRRLLARIEGN